MLSSSILLLLAISCTMIINLLFRFIPSSLLVSSINPADYSLESGCIVTYISVHPLVSPTKALRFLVYTPVLDPRAV